jgi:predicted ABC-type ATPase
MARVDPNVVYRCVRTVIGGASTIGVAWWPKIQNETVTWLANDDLGPYWQVEGRVRVQDDRHFIVTTDSGTQYEFFPLTIADLSESDPYLCQEHDLETDLEVQEWWPRVFFAQELGLKEIYDEYMKDGGVRTDFSDETAVLQPAGEIEEAREAARIGTVRTWCSRLPNGEKDCNEYKKITADKWVRLPKLRRVDVKKLAMVSRGSLAWVDSDPSLPMNSRAVNSVQNSDGTWSYTPERQELHRAILSDLFKGKQRSAKPTAVFVMGPPASGKSFTSRMRSEVSGSSVVRIDPDELRTRLPEYDAAIKKRVRNAGSITYEEAQHLNNEAVAQAMGGGYDFVMDAAGGTSDKGIAWFKKTMTDLKTRGYDVQVHMHVTPDLDKLLLRNEDRGLRSGRFVPAGTIKAAMENTPRQFDAYKDLADSMFVYDTSGVDDDPPTPVRQVFTKMKDARTSSDPEFMRNTFGVAESVTLMGDGVTDRQEAKMPSILDMSATAVSKRLIADLEKDAAHVRKAAIVTAPDEGVTWDLFDPAPYPADYRPTPTLEAQPKVGALKQINGGFYEYQADGTWTKLDWFP